MPKLRNSTPKYRLHKYSGKAVVTLDGKVIYLGKWDSKASRREYDRLVGEWLAAGRCLPSKELDHSVLELCNAYRKFAVTYYRKNGKPTRTIERIQVAIKYLRSIYGSTRVPDFGPLALRAIQNHLVKEKKGRKYINYLTAEIKRMFKWGVSCGNVPRNDSCHAGHPTSCATPSPPQCANSSAWRQSRSSWATPRPTSRKSTPSATTSSPLA